MGASIGRCLPTAQWVDDPGTNYWPTEDQDLMFAEALESTPSSRSAPAASASDSGNAVLVEGAVASVLLGSSTASVRERAYEIARAIDQAEEESHRSAAVVVADREARARFLAEIWRLTLLRCRAWVSGLHARRVWPTYVAALAASEPSFSAELPMILRDLPESALGSTTAQQTSRVFVDVVSHANSICISSQSPKSADSAAASLFELIASVESSADRFRLIRDLLTDVAPLLHGLLHRVLMGEIIATLPQWLPLEPAYRGSIVDMLTNFETLLMEMSK